MNTSEPEKAKPALKPMENGQRNPPPWLRLWHNFLDNPKVRQRNAPVTNANARATLEVRALRALYIDLLCVACRTNSDGRLPELDQVAFLMRISEEEARKTISELVKLRLIEKHGNTYWIHDWEHWQFSKSPAAVRQQKVRDRKKALRNALRNESHDALRNGDVTEAQRVAQRFLARAESESESESEKKNLLPSEPSGDASDADADAHAHAHARDGDEPFVPSPALLEIQAEIEHKRAAEKRGKGEK